MSIATVLAATRRARRDLDAARRACPLTEPLPPGAFAGADTPAFVEACNALGWAPLQDGTDDASEVTA